MYYRLYYRFIGRLKFTSTLLMSSTAYPTEYCNFIITLSLKNFVIKN